MDKITNVSLRSRLRTGVCAVVVLVALVLTTTFAGAIEAPRGATEVRVPISLSASSPIAGAEIAFTQTEGLHYLHYEPEPGIGNTIYTSMGDKIWVGFFSDDNIYSPDADNRIEMGVLVFGYEGSDEEHVTICDVKLHRLTGGPEIVETTADQPNTYIAVTRQPAPGAEIQQGGDAQQSGGNGQPQGADAENQRTSGTPVAIDKIPVANAPVAPGSIVDLPLTVVFADGSKADVTWTSTNPSVAKVNADGKLVAIKEGKATLTATAKDGRKQTITVTVAKPVTTVRTPLKIVYMKKGSSLALPVCADSVNIAGKADTKAMLAYKSNRTKVATVGANGKIKAKKTGTAKIKIAALNGKSTTVTVKVVAKSKALKAVTLVKAPKSMKVGQTKILKLKATPSRATNLKVTFKSSRKSVATVDKAGKVTALKKGKAKISVKIGKRKYVKTVTVK